MRLPTDIKSDVPVRLTLQSQRYSGPAFLALASRPVIGRLYFVRSLFALCNVDDRFVHHLRAARDDDLPALRQDSVHGLLRSRNRGMQRLLWQEDGQDIEDDLAVAPTQEPRRRFASSSVIPAALRRYFKPFLKIISLVLSSRNFSMTIGALTEYSTPNSEK
jgi:hypothetical protein